MLVQKSVASQPQGERHGVGYAGGAVREALADAFVEDAVDGAAVGGRDVLADDVGAARFRNFGYYNPTGTLIPTTIGGGILTFSATPITHLTDGSFENGSPFQGGTQVGKWIKMDVSGIPVSGFTFQAHRQTSGAGSVLMSAIDPLALDSNIGANTLDLGGFAQTLGAVTIEGGIINNGTLTATGYTSTGRAPGRRRPHRNSGSAAAPRGRECERFIHFEGPRARGSAPALHRSSPGCGQKFCRSSTEWVAPSGVGTLENSAYPLTSNQPHSASASRRRKGWSAWREIPLARPVVTCG